MAFLYIEKNNVLFCYYQFFGFFESVANKFYYIHTRFQLRSIYSCLALRMQVFSYYCFSINGVYYAVCFLVGIVVYRYFFFCRIGVYIYVGAVAICIVYAY